MSRRSFRFLQTLVVSIALTGTVMAQERTITVDVSGMQPGLEPQGFTFGRTGEGAPAEWRIVDDSSASKGKAIAQTSNDTTEYRFPLAVYTPVSAKNVDVTVRLKPVAGKVDEAGGIAALKGVRIKVAPSQWHTLGLRAEEDRFTISFDGKPLFTAEDRTFGNSGRVALWTKADSVTHFDALTITALDK